MNCKNVIFIKIEMALIQSILVLESWLIGQNNLKKFSLFEFGIKNIGYYKKKVELHMRVPKGLKI
jgi:hypothetical protein